MYSAPLLGYTQPAAGRLLLYIGSEIDQYWSVVGAVLVTLRSSTGH